MMGKRKVEEPGLDYRQGETFHNVCHWALAPNQWVLGTKRPGSEPDHSPKSSAELENGEDMPPHPQYVIMVWCLIN